MSTHQIADVQIDPQERYEDALYDLKLAKAAWSGRSVEEIEKDLGAVREKEAEAWRTSYEQGKAAQLARFDLMKEHTRALAVRACEAELEEAKRAPGIVL